LAKKSLLGNEPAGLPPFGGINKWHYARQTERKRERERERERGREREREGEAGR